MLMAELPTLATLGIDFLAYLLVLARPVAVGLDPIPPVKVTNSTCLNYLSVR